MIGILIAWWLYIRRPEAPARLAAATGPLYRLLLNKWYFDEIYDAVFVRPARRLGTLFWIGGDGRIIDGYGPNGVAARVVDLARRATRLQTGYVYHYAFAMLIGLVAVVSWVLLQTGG